jgi:hypothetical protein
MNRGIQELLEEIKHKELVLPEFQREYDWSRDQVRKLFDSLYRDYPTGSLLVWITDNPPKIKNDAYDLDKVRRVNVLLDGQQRLTSIYIHRYGETPPYYDEDEIPENYFDLYFNVRKGEFSYYKKKEMKDNPYWIKLHNLFSEDISPYDITDNDDELTNDQKRNIDREIGNNLTKIEKIMEQVYPIQTVPSDADIREAVKVFDLVNSQGTPLNTADIVLAHMTSEWPVIRRKLKDKISELEDRNFYFDLTFMTRCLVAVIKGDGNLEYFKDTNESELKDGWETLDEVLDYLVSFLKNEGYIVKSDDLSSDNVLVPLVAYLAHEGWFEGNDKNKFLHWAYAALYQSRYSSSADTYLQQDISALLKEPQPETLITALKEDEGDPEVSASNLDMRGVGHALYNMMNIVIRARGAVDWSNGASLEDNVGQNFEIERHHIFPKAVLEEHGWDTGESFAIRKRVHEIANRIPMTRPGNIDIFDKEPAGYLPKVEKEYPGVLEDSLVPEDSELWEADNYEDFLARRRVLIARAINQFMDGLLADRSDKEETSVQEIINRGEGEQVEFKSTMRWNVHAEQIDTDLEHTIAKTVAAFANKTGGTLLIGVDDDGKILGLEDDYQTLGDQDQDGFSKKLTQVLTKYLGNNVSAIASTNIVEEEGKDVCVVSVDESGKPLYLKNSDKNKEEFYVRFGATSRPHDMSEAEDYINQKW